MVSVGCYFIIMMSCSTMNKKKYKKYFTCSYYSNRNKCNWVPLSVKRHCSVFQSKFCPLIKKYYQTLMKKIPFILQLNTCDDDFNPVSHSPLFNIPPPQKINYWLLVTTPRADTGGGLGGQCSNVFCKLFNFCIYCCWKWCKISLFCQD